MGGALHILQAGELCLDEPLSEFSLEIPHNFRNSGLQSSIINARYQAARNLFEAAITDRVDLVLLAGKLCINEDDPRPYWFLQEQFTQLSKHRIVVVCVETRNSFRWPSTIPLPDNVRIIDRKEPIELHVYRNNHMVSLHWHNEKEEVGRKRESDFNIKLHEKGGCLTSIGYCFSCDDEHESIPVHAIQASSLSQAGPFQATLVEVNELADISTTPVRTEAVACESLPVDIRPGETLPQLRNRLIEEIHEFETRRGLTSIPTLLKISLRVSLSTPSKRPSFTLNLASQRELLFAVQEDACEPRSRIWPCRIEVEACRSEQLDFDESMPIQIAFKELAGLTLSEVSDHLDRQPLNMNQQLFQRLKSQVALRIPNCLAE